MGIVIKIYSIRTLNSRLSEAGLGRLRTNTKGAEAYYYISNNEAFAIVVLDFTMGDELDSRNYEQLYAGIQQTFNAKGYIYTNILTIVVTGYPEKVRELITTSANYWIIDVINNRLMIYEDQPEDFLGVKKIIDKTLEENAQGTAVRVRTSAGRYFCMCNMILVLLNCLVFLYTEIAGSSTDTTFLVEHGALSWWLVIEEHEYYRLITHMFLHAGFGHLINNMFLQTFLGSLLERIVGRVRFVAIYLLSGIGAGIVSIGVRYYEYKNLDIFEAMTYTETVSVGASGAIFGIIGAIAYIVIRNKGRIANLGRQRMLMFVAFSLYGGFVSEGVDNAAHVGGLIAGFIVAVLIYRKQTQRRISE